MVPSNRGVNSLLSHRRDFLAQGLALGATGFVWGSHALAADGGLVLESPRHFSFEWLRQKARSLSNSAFKQAASPAADIVKAINFDAAQKIKFRADCALWANGPQAFPIRFFHLNEYVGQPVDIHVLTGVQARKIVYHSRYFDYGGTGLEGKLPENLGFAGFRVMSGHAVQTDWLAFQGASYFRSSGQDNQYGASARGIAVDTALSTQEEFPRFRSFWIAEAPAGRADVTIYALLDGPSITGAYKFEANRDSGVIMNVHAELFARADIQRLGIAPLTSMYWYSESNYRWGGDWRPEIHDSDGLALWTGRGERIWRPLFDPSAVQTNSFVDNNPRGFGLMQRDRDFNDYQDDSAFYNRRPGIWVEPLGQWGEGAVQLIEIPTDDEIHDNIVAYWQPKAPVQKGDVLTLDYRLYWQDNEPHPPISVARVVATRIGRGGVPGQPPQRDKRKFVIDFEGGPLSQMPPRFDMKPVVTLSRGKVDNNYVVKVVGTSRWRAFFDVSMDGKEPIDMRCFLRLGDQILSETWLYQYFPQA
jgi:glucans biosynthesis protein